MREMVEQYDKIIHVRPTDEIQITTYNNKYLVMMGL